MGNVWDSIKHLRWPGGAPGSQGGRFKKGGSGGQEHEPRAIGDTRPAGESHDAWAQRIADDAGKRHQPPPGDMETSLRRAELARHDAGIGRSGSPDNPVRDSAVDDPARPVRTMAVKRLGGDTLASDEVFDPASGKWVAAHQVTRDKVAGTHTVTGEGESATFDSNQEVRVRQTQANFDYNAKIAEGVAARQAAWAGQISNDIGAKRGEPAGHIGLDAPSVGDASSSRTTPITTHDPDVPPWEGGPVDIEGNHQMGWESRVRNILRKQGHDPAIYEEHAGGFGQDYFEYQDDPQAYVETLLSDPPEGNRGTYPQPAR